MEKSNEKMRMVKRRMFAMRNGVIADTLRRAGVPQRIIFGLNLPQIAEIASLTGKDKALALELWANTSTRESLLLAPMVMPVDEFSIGEARQWVEQVPTTEVADVLCHRLLRHAPYALQIVRDYSGADCRMQRYTALRLMCSLGAAYPAEAAAIARGEMQRTDSPLLQLARRLLEFEEEDI